MATMTQDTPAEVEYGYGMLVADYNAGAPLQPVFQQAADAALAGRDGMLSGCMSVATNILRAHRSVTFGGAAAQFVDDVNGCFARINIMFAQRDYAGIGAMLSVLVGALEGARKATNGASITWSKKPVPKAQATNPMPMKVEVVSMPSRITESVVTQRDSEGNLAKVKQIERDLEPGKA